MLEGLGAVFSIPFPPFYAAATGTLGRLFQIDLPTLMPIGCVIPMSCEGAGRAHLILLVAAADGVSDQQLQAELFNHGSAAGIQPHEYPLQFVRVPEPFSKENGWRNANHKLMRKKIDEHWREDIDAAFAKDASKLEHYYK